MPGRLLVDQNRIDAHRRIETEAQFEKVLTDRHAGSHFKHYADRLELAFGPDERRFARTVLSQACQRREGIPIRELRAMSTGQSDVLHELEMAGYIHRTEDDRVAFRSNLLRGWWSRSPTPKE